MTDAKRLLGRIGVVMALLGTQMVCAEPRTLGGDFTLRDARGGVFRLAEQRDKVVMLFFGYVSCPDFCPTELAQFRDVMERLGALRPMVVPAFVSLDPGRDTPAVLAEYVRNFDPDIVPLTGSEGEIRAVAEAYGVRYEKAPTAGGASYTIDHTTRVYLIDKEGRLARAIAHGTPSGRIVQAIAGLLAY
jgi:protein SCO1/2